MLRSEGSGGDALKADWLEKEKHGGPALWRRPAAWLVAAACVGLPLAGWQLYAAQFRAPVPDVAAPAAAAEEMYASSAEVAATASYTDDAFADRRLARQEQKPSFVILPPPYIEHVVAAGENIWDIALEYGTDMESIAAINDMGISDVLQPGQTLRVLVGQEGLIHTVAEGDTVEALADRFDIRVDAIVAANGLRGDALTVGQEIVLPGARMPQRRTVTVASVSRSGGSSSESAAPSLDGFIWPHHGLVTSYFGWRDGGFHSGIDIDGWTGDAVMAAKAGTVTHAGWGWSGFGIYIVVDHGDGTKTIYAHLDDVYVAVGAEVAQGEVIGALGNTGWSTGSHLHFEILVNGSEIDPLPSLP